MYVCVYVVVEPVCLCVYVCSGGASVCTCVCIYAVVEPMCVCVCMYVCSGGADGEFGVVVL